MLFKRVDAPPPARLTWREPDRITYADARYLLVFNVIFKPAEKYLVAYRLLSSQLYTLVLRRGFSTSKARCL